MNKMTKGALATGLGVALLLGGGGTLAVWNDTVSASAGSIVAGNLDLTAEAGVWTNAYGDKVGENYRVVPGDTLTYTQPVGVTLTGDLMKANLTVTEKWTSNFDAGTVTTSDVLIKDLDGKPVANPISATGKYVASTTFAFSADTAKQASTNAVINYGAIGYKLEQIAPPAPPASDAR